MRHWFFILCLCLLPWWVVSPAMAQSSDTKGLEIMTEADWRDMDFGDYICNMVMSLRNRNGQESVRHIRVRVREQLNDGEKSIAIFDNPRDVKGTIFLNHTHKTGDDDQWLYLPALKRIKRISARNKSGSFMGSEFAYEDIASQEIEKYTYAWLRNETYGDQPCFVVERYPVDRRNSGYTRQVVWLDQQAYRIQKIDYYDRKHSLLKTLTYSGYQQYLGQYWRADEMFMKNHQSGKSTRLTWSDYQFRTGLTDADFKPGVLRRLR